MLWNLSIALKIGIVWARNVSGRQISGERNVSRAKYWGAKYWERNTGGKTSGSHLNVV